MEDSAVVAWTDETLHNVEYDDHAAYVVGSPTNPSIVAAGCTAVSLQPILEGGVATGESRYDCTEDSRVLRVYAAADGTVVHEVPGVWTVYVASEHFALVQTADADRMVDLDAAAFVDGQSWPRGTFLPSDSDSINVSTRRKARRAASSPTTPTAR